MSKRRLCGAESELNDSLQPAAESKSKRLNKSKRHRDGRGPRADHNYNWADEPGPSLYCMFKERVICVSGWHISSTLERSAC
mmetsp:Transcript_3089/g.14551  ORF Transcript_3089/g.14551 Transcript_3089/m.14551 type:complete len:82 (-) Transcript_3089:171-416(-)